MLLALIGLLLTVIWLLGGVWYVAEAIGFENLLFLLPSELGQMAIGFLLPLVLLWLVLGYLHIGNRLRRLEETLWELATLRPARSGGGSSAPDDQGWLDLESEEQQGRAAGGSAATTAPASLRSRRPFAGAGGASMAPGGGTPSWAQRGTRAPPASAAPTAQATPTQVAPPQPTPAEPPRRSGLASEIFSSRMRDRLAEEQAAARSGPAQSAAPQAAPSKRSAAKPPPMRPTLLQGDAAKPVPEKTASQRPSPHKSAAQKAEWQKPSSSPPLPAAVNAETPQAAVDNARPAAPQQPEPAVELAQEAPAAAPKEPSEAPAAPRPAEPVAASAQQAPAPAPEQSGSADAGEAPAAAPPNEPPESAPEQESDAAPAANSEAAAPAAKPVGFRHLVRITSMELNSIAMDLAGLLCRDADHAQALKGYDKGQKDVFFDLLSEQLSKQKPADALKRLQSAGGDQLMIHYLRKFDALVTESKGVDRSGALAKSLEAMPIGRLNTRLQALRAETW